MRDLDWKERIGAETTHRSLERQKAKAKEKHDNADLAHAAHQHAVNEAEFATAERATGATGATSAQKRLDIAQRALRASQGILERLLEGGEG